MDTTMQMGLKGSGMVDMTLQQFSKPNGQIGLVGSVSSSALPQQIPMTIQQTQALETVARDRVQQQFSASNLQIRQMESQVYTEMSSQFLLPNRQSGDLHTMLDNVESHQSSALTKRNAPVDFSPNMIPTMRVAQVEHKPWLQQVSLPNKLPVQMQSSPTGSESQNFHLSPKRPSSSKPGSLPPLLQKNLSGRMQPSPKSRNESESVRFKLTESLASALALVSQEKNKTSDGKNSPSDTGTTPGQKQKSSELPSTAGIGGLNASQENSVNGGNTGGSVSSFKDSSHDLSSNILLRDEDTVFSDSFFVKDELLQGNGLAWVLEPVAEMAETKVVEPAGKQQDLLNIRGLCKEQTTETPETLAVKIEEELFKLHGGVNKKYKEKGRSLVFNLKDRNNPELRERVMRGGISPERLCTMTAEDLASKELSEWRIAKAEEMAQMVVLPDSDVDVRRLVKKTHKGEFQVEVEEPDSVSMEVAVGANSQPQVRPKSKVKEAPSPENPGQAKENVKSGKAKENVKSNAKRPRQANKNVSSNVQKSSSGQDASCTLMIPTEGSDLMQGLMGDDELKDLPPIVSLDEFMESLNSEPPFENLPVDAVKATSDSGNDNSLVRSESNSPVQTRKDNVDTPKTHKAEKVDEGETKLDVGDKSVEKNVKLTTKSSISISKIDHLWEGVLQLSISTAALVIGIFKSGERTSVKEWPSSIEIKGRVRLDAFEKFLHHLPMSRSRAVMAVHLVSKEGSPESERASLSEVAESYVVDGRVGLSEPMPGTELYMCPPHAKTREMLGKVLTSDQVDALNDIDNGLIGIVVWRKITSAASPNSSSKHKHDPKRQRFTTTSRRQYPEKDSNLNAVNTTPRNAQAPAGPPSFPNKHQTDDDDDDVPPGFGPPGRRDEDDLPEFNFSIGSIPSRPQPSIHNPSRTPSRPTDQIRELIHRYGQPGTTGNWNEKRASGVARPWDDDDDMPEWNPDEHQRPQQQQPVHLHSLQPPMLRAHVEAQMSHRQMISPSTMLLQPSVNVGHGPQGAAASWQQDAWMPSPVAHNHAAYQQPGGGQFSGSPGQKGMAWRSDTPRSRGF